MCIYNSLNNLKWSFSRGILQKAPLLMFDSFQHASDKVFSIARFLVEILRETI